MSIRKHLAALMAVAMLCGAFTACGGDSAADSSAPTKETPTTEANENSEAPAEVTEAETVDLGTPTAAASGQAYLAMADSQCWIQYNGSWYYLNAGGYMVTGWQTIGGKTYDTVCVMDIEDSGCGVISEQFLDKNGRTILWRRFNRNDWAIDRYKQPWTELLPSNERLTVNGTTYVHWYDCITDYIL